MPLFSLILDFNGSDDLIGQGTLKTLTFTVSIDR